MSLQTTIKSQMIEAIDRLVRILQVIIPLAAAKQLGRLEEREYWNPDDEELVKRRLLVAKLLGTLTS